LSNRHYITATAKRGKCVKFIYGGCKGNDNRFLTKRDCKQTCMGGAKETSNPGPEDGTFAYDTEDGKCVRFTYGGCGGNENNFSTRQKCEQECMEQDTHGSNNDDNDDSDGCLQPIQTGPCFGSFRRYAYDRNSHQCVLFTYGGCGGNDNNFNTMKDCMATCEDVNGNHY
ncbi:Kunitz/Bovine pancreatic trypsin inhibitor domain protein, partial [Ancylostoma duodenale]